MGRVEREPSKSEIRDAVEQTEKAQKEFGSKKGTSILDSDTWIRWQDLISEHRYDRCVMAQNEQLRKEYNEGKRPSTNQTTAMSANRHFRHLARIPQWLWLRMEVLTQDPDFWKDDSNLRKILEIYPEYAMVDPKTI